MSLLALLFVAAANLLRLVNPSLANVTASAIYSPIIPKTSPIPTVLSAATTAPTIQPTSQPKVEKIGPSLYRAHISSDNIIPTPPQIIEALNDYRQKNDRGPLQQDERLCSLAQHRALVQDSAGGLDSHAGFKSYLQDAGHWDKLGVTGIGENSAWNFQVSAGRLIEEVFSADAEHQNNQLNPDWTLACAAVSGKTVDIIFGRH